MTTESLDTTSNMEYHEPTEYNIQSKQRNGGMGGGVEKGMDGGREGWRKREG